MFIKAVLNNGFLNSLPNLVIKYHQEKRIYFVNFVMLKYISKLVQVLGLKPNGK